MTVHATIPTEEGAAERSISSRLPWLPSKFEVSLSYMILSQKTTNQQTKPPIRIQDRSEEGETSVLIDL